MIDAKVIGKNIADIIFVSVIAAAAFLMMKLFNAPDMLTGAFVGAFVTRTWYVIRSK